MVQGAVGPDTRGIALPFLSCHKLPMAALVTSPTQNCSIAVTSASICSISNSIARMSRYNEQSWQVLPQTPLSAKSRTLAVQTPARCFAALFLTPGPDAPQGPAELPKSAPGWTHLREELQRTSPGSIHHRWQDGDFQEKKVSAKQNLRAQQGLISFPKIWQGKKAALQRSHSTSEDCCRLFCCLFGF